MTATPELQIEGPVASITLRRPAQANRLTPDDLAVLAAHIEAVNARDDVLVLRLQAGGKHFCSGFEIGRIGDGGNGGNGGESGFEQVANALEDARPVTLALLQGGVYGGATDLALACDFRIGTPAVEMFMPAARLGLVFYRRGLERYVSRLGLDQAKRLFLTAECIDADAMKAIGFLTHLVAADELQARAQQLTDTLAGMAPMALLATKTHLNRIGRGALDVQALARDQRRAAASADLREGKAAWAEKRPPRFVGR